MNFCVDCGRDCEESIEGMCIGCWLKGRKLTTMPHHVDLKTCTGCGEFLIGDRWTAMKLEDAVITAALDSRGIIRDARFVDQSASVEENDPRTFTVNVWTRLDVMGHETEDEASTIVRVKNSVCKPCSRKLGSYYTSILQIRASKDADAGTVEEALEMVKESVEAQSANNKQLFITKTETVPGGVDVYLSSISLGRSIAKELTDAYCAESKESPKLVGKTSDGQDMYRLTYLVRLPEYRAGDVVVCEGRHCKLVRVSGIGGRVLDLTNFRERAVKRNEMEELRVFAKASDLKDATVVDRSESEIQVLHPDDYSLVDLRVPEGFEAGETVKTVSIDDVLYLVPRRAIVFTANGHAAA